MTIQEMEQRAEAFFSASNDEDWRTLRDELCQDFIRHVAETTTGELASMGRIVLAVIESDYEWWYA